MSKIISKHFDFDATDTNNIVFPFPFEFNSGKILKAKPISIFFIATDTDNIITYISFDKQLFYSSING